MSNTSSAKKAHKVTVKKTERNKSNKSRIKTFFKKVLISINDNKNHEEKKSAFRDFESEIMKGVTKKVYKKNTASRIVSRLAAKIAKSDKK